MSSKKSLLKEFYSYNLRPRPTRKPSSKRKTSSKRSQIPEIPEVHVPYFPQFPKPARPSIPKKPLPQLPKKPLSFPKKPLPSIPKPAASYDVSDPLLTFYKGFRDNPLPEGSPFTDAPDPIGNMISSITGTTGYKTVKNKFINALDPNQTPILDAIRGYRKKRQISAQKKKPLPPLPKKIIEEEEEFYSASEGEEEKGGSFLSFIGSKASDLKNFFIEQENLRVERERKNEAKDIELLEAKQLENRKKLLELIEEEKTKIERELKINEELLKEEQKIIMKRERIERKIQEGVDKLEQAAGSGSADSILKTASLAVARLGAAGLTATKQIAMLGFGGVDRANVERQRRQAEAEILRAENELD